MISLNYQRKGIGHQLLKYVIDEAIQRGFWKISLTESNLVNEKYIGIWHNRKDMRDGNTFYFNLAIEILSEIGYNLCAGL